VPNQVKRAIGNELSEDGCESPQENRNMEINEGFTHVYKKSRPNKNARPGCLVCKSA
jgi:hypothetical protein